MSFNEQRIEHEKRDKITPFSQSMYERYRFPWRPHAMTMAYHDDVVSRCVPLQYPENCADLNVMISSVSHIPPQILYHVLTLMRLTLPMWVTF
jgi:hypothetical protein